MQAYVRPRRVAGNKHVLVRHPGSWLPLPREGGWVTVDEYWARRIRDEDVVEVEPPTEDDPTPVSHEAADAVETAAGETAEQPVSPSPETEEPAAEKRRGR